MLVESKGFGEGIPFSYWMTCGIEESIGGGVELSCNLNSEIGAVRVCVSSARRR